MNVDHDIWTCKLIMTIFVVYRRIHYELALLISLPHPFLLTMATPSEALLKSFSVIVKAITSDPLSVGLELVSASLISQETLSKILNVPATPLEKSTILVTSVIDQVKIVPEKQVAFMKILQESIDESSYQSEY